MRTALEIGTIKWSAPEQDLREREQGRLSELMGAGPYQDEYGAGAELTPSQAVELALSRGIDTYANSHDSAAR